MFGDQLPQKWPAAGTGQRQSAESLVLSEAADQAREEDESEIEVEEVNEIQAGKVAHDTLDWRGRVALLERKRRILSTSSQGTKIHTGDFQARRFPHDLGEVCVHVAASAGFLPRHAGRQRC